MKYIISYATAFSIAHDLPDFTHTCDTLVEALEWIDGAIAFLKGVDDVVVYEINPA